MIISDLNYLETAAEASVQGGGWWPSQSNYAKVNITQYAAPTAVAINFGKYGSAKAYAPVYQNASVYIKQEND